MDKRAQLKKFVRESSNNPFVATPRRAARAYNLINQCIFKGALKKPTLLIERLDGFWGLCEGEIYTGKDRELNTPVCHRIRLNDTFPSRRMFIEVLAHEMVHQYQCEYLNRMDHGRTFWEWEQVFSRYNLDLFKTRG